jgi:hypothetical protein
MSRLCVIITPNKIICLETFIECLDIFTQSLDIFTQSLETITQSLETITRFPDFDFETSNALTIHSYTSYIIADGRTIFQLTLGIFDLSTMICSYLILLKLDALVRLGYKIHIHLALILSLNLSLINTSKLIFD